MSASLTHLESLCSEDKPSGKLSETEPPTQKVKVASFFDTV